MVQERYDVIIVGAGVLGCAAAYHMKRISKDRRVLLVDQNSGPGEGNTAKSAALFRKVFSSRLNRQLTSATIEFLRRIEASGYNLNLRDLSYLWLLDSEGQRVFLKKEKRLRAEGVQLTYLGADELTDALDLRDKPGRLGKYYSLPRVAGGVLAKECGAISATRLTRYYEREFLDMGGEVLYDCRVKHLKLTEAPGVPRILDQQWVDGIDTSKGRIYGKDFILTAGTWTGELLHPLGIDPRALPKKRQLFMFKGEPLGGIVKPSWADRGIKPVIILPVAGIYLKPLPSKYNYLVGCADNLGRPFIPEDRPEAEPEYYKDQIRPALERYFPRFKQLEPIHSWAGLYSINTADGNPNVFRKRNLTIVTGTTGSGVMKSDSLGRVAAAACMDKDEAVLFNGETVDVSQFGIQNRCLAPEELVI